MNETLYIASFLENNDREIQKTASLSQSQFLPQQVYRALYNDDIEAAVRKYKEYCNKLEVIGFDEYAASVISWIRIFEARGVLESETVDRFMNAI